MTETKTTIEESVSKSPPKSETFKDFETNELSDASLNIRKWMNLGYRLYGNMLDNSEYSFFISIPQIISQLAFLMSICQEKTTGLRSEFGWTPTTGEPAHQVQHNNLMENTEKFMRKWRRELNETSVPGDIKSARRALCHPSCAVSFHLNTLECLRRFLVELKLFEGAMEHRNWVAQNLEGNFEKQVVINVWEEENLNNESAESEKKSNDKQTIEHDKRSPILIWISSASIAILPEIFDVKFVYTLKSIDYFRVTSTPTITIRERESEMPWNMIILPCVNEKLCFVIIYGFSRNLCPYEDLRVHINEHRPIAPCIIRKNKKKQSPGTETQKEKKAEKTKKNIYFPYWDDTNFNPNQFSEGLKRVADIEATFTKGGYGDLANSNATPISGGDMYRIGHLQNFSTLRFFNSPSTRMPAITEDLNQNITKTQIDRTNPDDEVIPFPFSAILWDSNRHVPVFMGKITGKDANIKTLEKRKIWNLLTGWMKLKH